MKQKFKAFCLSRDAGAAEWAVLAVWVALVCIIRQFHEPWFDETQAWQIARFASLRELLTEVEHYEGHPPLWHLILMPFARAELPYKLTIFCINLAFSGAGVWLLLFRSPLPRVLRWYLPFTFYIFYLHSVHTRPYSMMMLAFFLAAMAYPRRNEHPGRYVGAMIFLCFTTVYGVLFSCGLCLVWGWEILGEYRTGKRKFREIARDARFWWLLLILAAALLILGMTLPAPDNYNGRRKLTWLLRLERLHYVPLLLFDATFGTILMEDEGLTSTTGLVLGTAIGAVLWLLLIPLLKRNQKLLLCLVPYLIAALFCAFVYFGVHHLEVFQLFFIFILWTLFGDGIEMPEIYGKVRSKIDSRLTMLLLKVVSLAALCAPLVYTVGSSVLEVRYRYGPTEMAEYIKEHHLENRRILVSWGYENEGGETGLDAMVRDETLPLQSYPAIKKQLTTFMGDPASVYAYFDRDADFFTYFNVGESQQKWMLWKDQTEEELQATFERWQEIGLPDFVFGSVPIQEAFTEEQLDGVTYYWVDNLEYGKIWKLDYSTGIDHVYIRSDLLDEYPEFHIHTYAEEAKKKD